MALDKARESVAVLLVDRGRSWPSVDIDVDRVAVVEYVRARHPA
jgi:hypothetical protein